MERRSGQFGIYKKLGAAQLSYIPSKWNDKGFHDRNGCVIVDAAPGLGKQQWDWSKKITFAIGPNDITQLMENLERPKRLLHDHNGDIKTLEFVPGEGQYEGTYMMKFFIKSTDGTTNGVQVPLSAGEYAIICTLFGQAFGRIVGWWD